MDAYTKANRDPELSWANRFIGILPRTAINLMIEESLWPFWGSLKEIHRKSPTPQ